MLTARDLSAEALSHFRVAARARQQREAEALARREGHAWELAQQAARLLYAQFGADRVVTFSSLTRPGCFNEWSDLDLAAWGLHPSQSLRAMTTVADLDAHIAINLVDVATCSEDLLCAIEREGRPL